MRPLVSSALSFALAAGLLTGCNGSGDDNTPIVPNGPPVVAAEEDQRTPQSDAMTAAEASLVNQANAEPSPGQKPDL